MTTEEAIEGGILAGGFICSLAFLVMLLYASFG